MSKLGVEVGDEFPADEVRTDTDQNGVVHHHHYHYRRRPFRFLRFFLVVTLFGMVFRALHFVLGPSHWRGDDRYGANYYGWSPIEQLIGLGVGIAIVSGALWFIRRRDPEGRC